MRRALKPIAQRLFRLSAPVIRAIGFDAKKRYELAYWRAAKRREGDLRNAWYGRAFTKWIGVRRAFYRDKRILDIGCGPRGSLEWATMAAERVGLDPLVDDYRALGIDQHEMSYVAAPCEAIPFPDGSFDVVLSLNSLDHVDDLDACLAEITRVLADRGEFILIVHVHAAPTIAEPVTVPWDLTNRLAADFRVIDEHHYELGESDDSVVAAVRQATPFDHDNPEDRYGVLFARLRRRARKASA